MVATHIPGVTHSFFSFSSFVQSFRFRTKFSFSYEVYSSNFNAASASSPFAFAARPSPVLSFTS